GIYHILITAENNCSNTSIINVSLYSPISAIIDTEFPNLEICGLSTCSLNAVLINENYFGHWESPNANVVFQDPNIANTCVTVENYNTPYSFIWKTDVVGMPVGFCQSTDTLSITFLEIPIITVQSTPASSVGTVDGTASVLTNPNHNILWSTNDTTATISNLLAGTYSVTVSNGICENSSSVFVDYLTIIPSEDSNISISIYPNPNNGIFTIKINDIDNFEKYQIISELGTLILEDKIVSNLTNVNINNLSAGTYFVKLISRNGEIFDKIIVN
ncbi:MAG: T9SS type A sorting domain-containing protein, partial [Bacteroidales bacterium]|nr:T9SS type A sorting domain-containing protein [Bacteroidales bacterium]